MFHKFNKFKNLASEAKIQPEWWMILTNKDKYSSAKILFTTIYASDKFLFNILMFTNMIQKPAATTSLSYLHLVVNSSLLRSNFINTDRT